VAFFEYDLEGHIIGRADKATALTSADFFAGYNDDPDAQPSYDEYGFGQSVTQQVQRQLFGGAASASTRLQSYLYADNKPISEAAGDQVISLRTLRLSAGTPVVEGGSFDTPGTVTGYSLTLVTGDIATRGDGSIDRTQTARNIAVRAYEGFTSLSAGAQAKVVAYVEGRLPADAQVREGAVLSVYGFIQLADASYANLTQVTDYSLRQLGADGVPGGTVQSHVVRAGDTLQGIAAMYFGSPSYWYLIAEANGLAGSEALVEGTTLTIPNAVANSAGTAETFKVYNESEIIGSTSPGTAGEFARDLLTGSSPALAPQHQFLHIRRHRRPIVIGAYVESGA
jgi:hypothetical protein